MKWITAGVDHGVLLSPKEYAEAKDALAAIGIAVPSNDSATFDVLERSLPDEEWRPTVEAAGVYEVSNLGRVRRVLPGTSTHPGRIVKPIAVSNGSMGYGQVAFCVQPKTLRRYIHRVVMAAFVGPCPVGHVVNHRDGIKMNNALENLEYVTIRENQAHAIRAGLRAPRRMHCYPKPAPPPPPSGADHWTKRQPERIARGERMNHKLTTEQVVEMRARVASGEMQKTVAREMGVSVAQASRIVRGTRWGHIPVIPVASTTNGQRDLFAEAVFK